MKRPILCILSSFAAAAFLTVIVARADDQGAPLSGTTKVQMNELPAAVQNTIKAQAGAAPIEDIDKGTLNGRVVYEVAFKKDGQHTELRVAEDGTVIETLTPGQPIKAPAGAAAEYNRGFNAQLSNASKVSFEATPPAVQAIIKERAGSAQIEDIDKGMLGTTTAYQAAYKKNGKHTELRVTEDGKFVREVQDGVTIYSTEKSLIGKPAGTPPVPTVQPGPISFEALPGSVQNFAKMRAQNTPIQNVTRSVENGKTVYNMSYTRNGQPVQLTISADGTIAREVVGGKVVPLTK